MLLVFSLFHYDICWGTIIGISRVTLLVESFYHIGVMSSYSRVTSSNESSWVTLSVEYFYHLGVMSSYYFDRIFFGGGLVSPLPDSLSPTPTPSSLPPLTTTVGVLVSVVTPTVNNSKGRLHSRVPCTSTTSDRTYSSSRHTVFPTWHDRWFYTLSLEDTVHRDYDSRGRRRGAEGLVRGGSGATGHQCGSVTDLCNHEFRPGKPLPHVEKTTRRNQTPEG